VLAARALRGAAAPAFAGPWPQTPDHPPNVTTGVSLVFLDGLGHVDHPA